MIDYIENNKEWIFSGIGVTVIVGIARQFWKFIAKQSGGGTAQVIVMSDPEQVTKNEAASVKYPQEQYLPAHITRISPITYNDINAAFDAAPPMQRDAIAKSYEGIYIRWKTSLFDASPYGEHEARLILEVDKNKMKAVNCIVRIEEYKELGVMPRGASITVVGRIKEIDELSISLDDVHLYFSA